VGVEQDRTEREDTLIHGRNPVFEYLKSGGAADTLYLTTHDDRSYNHIVLLAREAGAVIKKTHPLKLDRLCGSDRHQGVALQCSVCTYREVPDILENARASGRPPFLVVADGIEDPHNLGAVIRSAECAGAHGVIIPDRHSCSVTPTVHRASAGACSHLPIARVKNLAREIDSLKQHGVFCYCADPEGEPCYGTDLTGACALVVGSEGSGVSRLVREKCDKAVSLPMLGKITSLNASVAAGILMYEYVRQTMRKERGGEV